MRKPWLHYMENRNNKGLGAATLLQGSLSLRPQKREKRAGHVSIGQLGTLGRGPLISGNLSFVNFKAKSLCMWRLVLFFIARC